ncbi:glycerol-3-phosphate 1-O-acyltransferase PlsY [Leptodesmis sichuanensis]|uniref:glycerol-3-phosphate 1-O-acyltransferase PlsY n=1 Tax=Leptodesmis sichuanensis TaxID=2906798 RepID=UPI001F35E67C|nr:glycerol-3-phosphate 1-O-acyltransferase PlsY [Leptodesmis sichuanensis]UIE37460.1 glycerol-3-phosphate 1-O-acyltransferase PlsY [Leptodesmis sichuanensis A121]
MALWLTLNALLILLAYLLGSLATGYWAGRWLKGIDIREHGSGSTGATNVLRTLGTGPGVVVLLIDVLKGVGAIALVTWFYTTDLIQPLIPGTLNPATWLPWMVTLAGIAALLGHSKSIFLNFTGGKSVATSLGVLLAMSWLVGVGTFAVFLLVLAITRIVSISSMSGAIAVPGLMLATHQPLPYVLFGLAGGLYVILRHRANIQRLLQGTEPRLGQKLPEPDSSAQS